MRRWAWVMLFGMVPSFLACGAPGTGKKEKVLATFKGGQVTESELVAEARMLPPYVQPIVETPAGKEQLLDSMITRDLLVKEALRRGVDRKGDVGARLAAARKSILIEALAREVAEKAAGLSDAELKKFYDANQPSFQVGERVKVSHVLYPDKVQAEAAARKARGGEPFEALMKEASASGGNAADLGFIEKGKFVKEFEDAAFAATPGSVVGPVRTQYGFHVIRVMEKKPAGLQPFDEVKGKIAAEVKEKAQREAFENLVETLKKQADVKVLMARPAPEAVPPAPATAPASGSPHGAEKEPAPAPGPAPHGGR